jgi:Caspase domain
VSGERAALLVATYEYEDPGLRELQAPEADAKALAQVLTDAEIAGYDVTMLLNEPHYVVGEAIGDFYQSRRRQDVALLYFTGHGLKDDDGHLYFAMRNTKRNSLLFTGLAAEQIDAAMEACPSQQKILILDCCYSGAFPAGRTAKADSAVHSLEKLRGRGRVVLTASDATEYAFEGDSIRGQGHGSVFTKYLVEGMKSGRADLDGDGDISLAELYSYAHDKVIEEIPQQRPKKNEDVEGSIVIGRNIHWTLPTYLTNAIGSPIARDRLAAIEGLAHLYRVGNPRVRTHVIEQMTLLGDDDSRSVATAAQQWLREQNNEAALEPGASASPPRAEPKPASGPAIDSAVKENSADQPTHQPQHRSEPAPADARGPAAADSTASFRPLASPPQLPRAQAPIGEPAREPHNRAERRSPDTDVSRTGKQLAPDWRASPMASGTAPVPRLGSVEQPAQRPGERRDRTGRPGAAVSSTPVDTPPTDPSAASPTPAAKNTRRTLAIIGLIGSVLCIVIGAIDGNGNAIGAGFIGMIISIIVYRGSRPGSEASQDRVGEDGPKQG